MSPRPTAYQTPSRSAFRHANPAQAWRRFFQRYFEFKGFASRSEFWWVQGPIGLGSLLYTLQQERVGAAMADNVFLSLLVLLVSLVLLIPSLAVHWRRLHDAGLAGPWWFLSLIPGLGTIAVLIMTLLPPRPEAQKAAWG